jgi:hypothetical protein
MRFLVATLFLLAQTTLHAGVLEGKVVIDGKIPKIKIKKAFNPYASEYSDGSDSHNYSEDTPVVKEAPQHLLLYLEGVPGIYKAGTKKPVLGQKNRQFTEDIVPVIAGGELEVTNEDTVYNHIRSSTKPWIFNLNKKAPGESVSVPFAVHKDEDNRVVPIYCDIHSSMRTHVVVLDNPFYVLMSETGGKFKIKNVPPGTYTLNAFHPTLKFEPFKVTISDSKTSKPITVTMVGEK